MAIITAVVIDSTRIDPHAKEWDLHTFNWIPFRMHITHTLIGFGDIFTGLWPFASLCYIGRRTIKNQSYWIGFVGGLVVFLAVFALEWRQQYVPGRYADITDAILAWLAWLIAWSLPKSTNSSIDAQTSNIGFKRQVSDTKKV